LKRRPGVLNTHVPQLVKIILPNNKMEYTSEDTTAIVHFFLHGQISNDMVEELFDDEEFHESKDDVELIDIANNGTEYWKDKQYDMIYVLHPNRTNPINYSNYHMVQLTDTDPCEDWENWKMSHFG
jgi:hypothetical protein